MTDNKKLSCENKNLWKFCSDKKIYAVERPMLKSFRANSSAIENRPEIFYSTDSVDYKEYSSLNDLCMNFSTTESGVENNTAKFNLMTAKDSTSAYVFDVGRSLDRLSKMNAEVTKRIGLLQSFKGDEEAGYPRPSRAVVDKTVTLVCQLYQADPVLEPPMISPSLDGDVLISWRTAGRYFIIYVDQDDKSDVTFKFRNSGSGNIDTKNNAIIRGLTQIVSAFHGKQYSPSCDTSLKSGESTMKLMSL
ncbi:hypothetical protein [Gluconacetobacter tumulisoli]|uniref:Uncharacterized protein n=1 Tax=Gluconacetobacter tumulisoli TaxID=1286189 RepID=A0A7W4K7A3_9PROT|nr:hypothetical protein [Gluconacetobacter tumulisoli]MBB2201646.1 hypothetical protein [Gluconacetobacter tumulisoli]